MTKHQKHLAIFQDIFKGDKLKVYPAKLEYRGVYNMESAVAQANRIIAAHQLSLQVVNNGALASYKAFEVIPAGQEAAAA